jgi:hypothetical protein
VSRPKSLDPMAQHALRMTRATWERAERLIAWLGAKRGTNATVSDVMREAISRGLSSMEKESKQ